MEIIKTTEINYPYFPDGANSLSLVLVSTSVSQIQVQNLKRNVKDSTFSMLFDDRPAALQETLLYDMNSLVGEVGGSLGLFLGLSLVNLYTQAFRAMAGYFPRVARTWRESREEK